MLSILTIVADEELRASRILTAMSHRQNTSVVILTWSRCLALDSITWATRTITNRATTLNNEIGNHTVKTQAIIEMALGQLYKVLGCNGSILGVEFGLHIALLGRNNSVLHSL
jgi:hypothetical protein